MKVFRQCKGILCLLLFFVGILSVHAQSNQGQVAGNVTDTTGAYVGGASITAKDQATGSVYTAVSTSAGSYRFPSIQIGRYTVTTAAKGFKATVSTGVEVRVGTVTALDIALSARGWQ